MPHYIYLTIYNIIIKKKLIQLMDRISNVFKQILVYSINKITYLKMII